MNCIEAREAMLVAEPSELGAAARGAVEARDGLGDAALTEHLRECDACRRRAGLLTTDLDRLTVRLRARSKRRTLMLAALPVAAVLVASVAIATRRTRQPSVVVPPHSDRPASVVSVDVGAGQRAAVIKTADPKITLVWISTGTN